jgi:hypothetical protein
MIARGGGCGEWAAVDVTAAELAVVGVAAPEVVIALAAQSAVGEYPGVCQLVHAPGARDDPCP